MKISKTLAFMAFFYVSSIGLAACAPEKKDEPPYVSATQVQQPPAPTFGDGRPVVGVIKQPGLSPSPVNRDDLLPVPDNGNGGPEPLELPPT